MNPFGARACRTLTALAVSLRLFSDWGYAPINSFNRCSANRKATIWLPMPAVGIEPTQPEGGSFTDCGTHHLSNTDLLDYNNTTFNGCQLQNTKAENCFCRLRSLIKPLWYMLGSGNAPASYTNSRPKFSLRNCCEYTATWACQLDARTKTDLFWA